MIHYVTTHTHQARNEWESGAPTVYPCLPGHEIVGRVAKAGSSVKKFSIQLLKRHGTLVLVGVPSNPVPSRRLD